MQISRKQQVAMAVIVAFGIVAGGAVLLSGRHKTDEEVESTQSAPVKETAASGASVAASEHQEREVKLDDAQLKKAGIDISAVVPGVIQAVAQFQGEVLFNDDR